MSFPVANLFQWPKISIFGDLSRLSCPIVNVPWQSYPYVWWFLMILTIFWQTLPTLKATSRFFHLDLVDSLFIIVAFESYLAVFHRLLQILTLLHSFDRKISLIFSIVCSMFLYYFLFRKIVIILLHILSIFTLYSLSYSIN